MKYLVPIFLFLSLAFSAQAAKQVSGTVPTVMPLQAPSAIAHANVSNNIELQSKTTNESAPQASGVQSDQEATSGNVSNMPVTTGQIQTAPTSHSGNYFWILWVIVILGLLVVGWRLWKRKS